MTATRSEAARDVSVSAGSRGVGGAGAGGAATTAAAGAGDSAEVVSTAPVSAAGVVPATDAGAADADAGDGAGSATLISALGANSGSDTDVSTSGQTDRVAAYEMAWHWRTPWQTFGLRRVVIRRECRKRTRIGWRAPHGIATNRSARIWTAHHMRLGINLLTVHIHRARIRRRTPHGLIRSRRNRISRIHRTRIRTAHHMRLDINRLTGQVHPTRIRRRTPWGQPIRADR